MVCRGTPGLDVACSTFCPTAGLSRVAPASHVENLISDRMLTLVTCPVCLTAFSLFSVHTASHADAERRQAEQREQLRKVCFASVPLA